MTKNSHQRPTVEPIKESTTDRDDETRHDHPAFAMIGINRVQNVGGNALYGSALDDHRTTMRIRICRSYMIHNLARDWHHDQGELIEVELSAAQFAEMLTSHNMGHGVPCTLRFVAGTGEVPRLPIKPTTEAGRVVDGFAKKLQAVREKLQPRANAIMGRVDKLGAKVKRAIEIDLEVILQEIGSNIPFALRSFNEATTKIVSAAKHEIEAFTMHGIVQAGLKALGVGEQQEPEPKQLVMPKCRARWRDGVITPPNYQGPTSADRCRLDAGHDGECTFIIDARARGWAPYDEPQPRELICPVCGGKDGKHTDGRCPLNGIPEEDWADEVQSAKDSEP